MTTRYEVRIKTTFNEDLIKDLRSKFSDFTPILFIVNSIDFDRFFGAESFNTKKEAIDCANDAVFRFKRKMQILNNYLAAKNYPEVTPDEIRRESIITTITEEEEIIG